MLIRKLMAFLGKDAARSPALIRKKRREKRQHWAGSLRSLSRNRSGPTYWGYRPDSHWVFGDHAEFATLLERWCAGSRWPMRGDLGRLYALILNLKQLIADQVPGHFAELGVYRGNSAAVLAHFAAASGRKLFLFDTFEGFDRRDFVGVDRDQGLRFADTSLEAVRSVVGHDDACVYAQGTFPGSLSEQARSAAYAFVHLDCDLYQPMREGLATFYERLSPGGLLFAHDYSSQHWAGATRAVDEFCAATGTRPILLPDKSGTAVFRKAAAA